MTEQKITMTMEQVEQEMEEYRRRNDPNDGRGQGGRS